MNDKAKFSQEEEVAFVETMKEFFPTWRSIYAMKTGAEFTINPSMVSVNETKRYQLMAKGLAFTTDPRILAQVILIEKRKDVLTVAKRAKTIEDVRWEYPTFVEYMFQLDRPGDILRLRLKVAFVLPKENPATGEDLYLPQGYTGYEHFRVEVSKMMIEVDDEAERFHRMFLLKLELRKSPLKENVSDRLKMQYPVFTLDRAGEK